MKKIALTLITLMLAASATAVVGGPEPEEGGLAITSTEPSKSYSTEFTVVNVTQSNQTGLANHDWQNNTVKFKGIYEAPTPCHTLTHKVKKQGNTFNFDITSSQPENTTCAQVVTYKEYEASFTTDQAYRLNVKHDGQSIEMLEHPKLEDEQDKHFFTLLVKALISLFQ